MVANVSPRGSESPAGVYCCGTSEEAPVERHAGSEANWATLIRGAVGLRIAKLVGGQLIRQCLFGMDSNPVAEMDGSGNWLQSNVDAGGQFLAEYQGTDTYFQHVNHLGTVHAESNSGGASTRTTTPTIFVPTNSSGVGCPQ